MLILALAILISFTAMAEMSSGKQVSWTGHWTFDNTLSDVSGNGQDAYLPQPAFAPGVEGQALLFTTNTMVAIADAPGVRLSHGFHLTCRVRLTRFPEGNAGANVAIKGSHSTGEYILRLDPASEGRRFSFFINSADRWEPRVSSLEPVQLNVWYQIEAGWDGQGLWLTVNNETTRIARRCEIAVSGESLILGPFDGELDDLRIASPGGHSTSVAYWPFEGDLRDASGHKHDFAPATGVFVPVSGGQALQLNAGSFSLPSTPDLQLAPGLRIGCSLLFKTIPTGITSILVKKNEYMLRLDSQEEGGTLSFFVNVNDVWEPRVRAKHRVETNMWYRVNAQWDGFAITLDVNGEQTMERRLLGGLIKPGQQPLTLRCFDGLINNLHIDNPKLSAMRLVDLTTDSTLLRAGRSERLSGTIRNYGNVVTGCVAVLELSPGVICETPAQLELGTLAANATIPVEWRVRSDVSLSASATVDLLVPATDPVRTQKVLAFLPAVDSDYSANAWNPPTATNSQAATYYVDAIGGDNAWSGTTPETAWHDFTPVNGQTLGPGDRLLIRRGSVINQELSLSAGGTAQAWAEIAAYGEGARPVIRRNRDIDDRCVLIKNPDYLIIRSLTVCYAGKGVVVYYAVKGHRGLLIEDCIAHHIEGLYRFNSHGIPEWRDRRGAPDDGGTAGGFVFNGSRGEDLIVRDCEMFQCSAGFRFSGNNVFVDRIFCHDNYAHNTSSHPYLTYVIRATLQNSIFDASGWHANAGTMGIMLGHQYGLIIRNCHFLNQPDSGSHDEGGIDFEAGGEGCLIDRCTFRNNAGAAIEVLGLKVPQTRNIEIAGSRFDRNNVAHKLGPSEIFIWGGTRKNPDVCCSTGLIRDNGYVLIPGVIFFTNQAPATTHWNLTNNTEYATAEALDGAMTLNNPPFVDAGCEIWSDRTTVRLAGKVSDDGKPVSNSLATTWEMLEGAGNVLFTDPAELETTAVFTTPGDYLLRLKADDGELWRSSYTVVHLLPPGTSVTRAWDFATPLDKQGWSDWELGTKDETFSSCIARPVRHVTGSHYVLAMLNTSAAHLLSPDALDLALDKNNTVAIRFQNHTSATQMRLRFTTHDTPAWASDLGQLFAVIPNDNEKRLYTLDLSDVAGWRGKLKQMRFDFSDGAPITGTCRIDYIWIGQSPQ